MTIRILNESDARVYQKLRLEGLMKNPEAYSSTYEVESKFTMETIVERMNQTDDKFTLGAFDEDDGLIGIVRFVRETGIKIRHKANIYGMYVSSEKRGQGAGKALLEALIKIAKETEGLERLYLGVISDNVTAKELYIRLGFKTYGIEQNALKTLGQYSDEELMVLVL